MRKGTTINSPISPELVLAAQKALVSGDSKNEGCLLRLVVQCETKISAFILRKMRARGIAKETCLHEDTTREVILILLKSALLLYKVEKDASFDTYLFRIAERVFSKILMKAEPAARISLNNIDVEILIESLQPRSTSDEQLTRIHLTDALTRLSIRERDAVLGHIFDGDTYQEIADQWDMPLSTTYRYIKAVFAKLRQELLGSEVRTKEQYTK